MVALRARTVARLFWPLTFLLASPLAAQDSGGGSGGGDIELSRAQIQAERQAIVNRAMELTDSESTKFWPLYREYRTKMAEVTDRQIAVINALHELAPTLPIVVRTAAPEWLFTRTTCGASLFLPGETDTGVVQIDSLRLDAAETVRRARAFLDRFDELAAREAAIIQAHDARLVIADAPPLACAAAAIAGVPAVVCANFTWDWIYREYSEQPGVDGIVAGDDGAEPSRAGRGAER